MPRGRFTSAQAQTVWRYDAVNERGPLRIGGCNPSKLGRPSAARCGSSAGLRVSVHSDDPAYFGGFLNDTLAATLTALPLTTDDAHALLRNSLESSFLDPKAISCHVTRLDAVFNAALGE